MDFKGETMGTHLYSTFQAPKLLGVAPDHVPRRVKSGELRASRWGGHHGIALHERRDSLVVEGPRPRSAHVDRSRPHGRDLLDHPAIEPHIPLVRITSASHAEATSDYCSARVVGHISRPLTPQQSEDLIAPISR